MFIKTPFSFLLSVFFVFVACSEKETNSGNQVQNEASTPNISIDLTKNLSVSDYLQQFNANELRIVQSEPWNYLTYNYSLGNQCGLTRVRWKAKTFPEALGLQIPCKNNERIIAAAKTTLASRNNWDKAGPPHLQLLDLLEKEKLLTLDTLLVVKESEK